MEKLGGKDKKNLCEPDEVDLGRDGFKEPSKRDDEATN